MVWFQRFIPLGLPAFESDRDRTAIRRKHRPVRGLRPEHQLRVKVDEHAEDNRVEANSITGAGGISMDDDRTDDDLPAAGPGHGREPTPGGWALAELVGDASVMAANGNMPMT